MPSSVVASMSYIPESAILRITYVSGRVYEYKDVPRHVYEAMKAAGSKGRYLNEFIKGHYAYKQVLD
ncbi:KTSC domain-containing protein [Pedobacter sp. HMWF019]|uniref:KTSC domain-containing protein n=1 Tax=Pedobacter sp. HMWF019 TaxID=2056856 RepID=UPI000D3D69C2|nr:KTSC domain-containing protein [Pedobacter sp. HMWF019]PTT03727.1 KTSC domain-containing protein [Pedobacter sp. HMWF019]